MGWNGDDPTNTEGDLTRVAFGFVPMFSQALNEGNENEGISDM